jgi:hypothetical protein
LGEEGCGQCSRRPAADDRDRIGITRSKHLSKWR